jgi:hypothetical protein
MKTNYWGGMPEPKASTSSLRLAIQNVTETAKRRIFCGDISECWQVNGPLWPSCFDTFQFDPSSNKPFGCDAEFTLSWLSAVTIESSLG